MAIRHVNDTSHIQPLAAAFAANDMAADFFTSAAPRQLVIAIDLCYC